MSRVSGSERELVVFENDGSCPICDAPARFASSSNWLRDHYVCLKCGSIPRERALMLTIERFFPGWRDLTIHESSPEQRGASVKLRNGCPNYSASQYYRGEPLGGTPAGRLYRNEDLERLTFPDESIDLFVTQDVMEHVLDPVAAFSEIRRVLRPGGAHVFSVPLESKEQPTRVVATRDASGAVVHLEPATYHGSPVDPDGVLVTRHWGYDIVEFILTHAGMPTTMVMIDDLEHGIRAELIEILVSRRPRE